MPVWLSTLVVIIYAFQLLSLIAVTFIENKDPVVTLSWMLALIFLPVIGFIFYLFFGRGLKQLSDSRLKLIKKIQEEFYLKTPGSIEEFAGLANFTTDDYVKFSDICANNHIDLIRMNLNLAFAPYTQNNSIKIYTSAREKYNDLFSDIRNAKHSVHLAYFIISNTNISHELIELLARKADEGVEVCVIYDELGNFLVPHSMFKKITKAGGKVYRFFPLSPRSILRANYRNHHKIVVIDGLVGYTGGMNIGDEYMGLHKRKTPWRDTHIRVTGSSVASLQLLFITDLVYTTNDKKLLKSYIAHEYFPPPIENGTVGMQMVSSGPDSDHEAIRRAYIKMIDNAKEKVYIQTPYLMPDQSVMTAIQNAAASGVEVCLMLPGIPDKRMVYLVTYSYIQNMLDYGVKVYIYNGFLHSKMVVVDDELSTIGTTNFDMRSFSMHFEVNDFIFDCKISKQCGDIFRDDIEKSYEMTREKYDSRNIFRKVLEKIMRLFAPLM